MPLTYCYSLYSSLDCQERNRGPACPAHHHPLLLLLCPGSGEEPHRHRRLRLDSVEDRPRLRLRLVELYLQDHLLQ